MEAACTGKAAVERSSACRAAASRTSFSPEGSTAPLLSEWEPIGPRTPNPDAKFWNNDNNNFSPHIGLSWSLPWFGKDKTVLRAGYSINYERNQLFLVNNQGFGVSGYSSTKVVLSVPTPFLLTDFKVPLPAASGVLEPVPLTDRAAPAYGFDPELRIPYNQNWSLSLQRAIGADTVVEARYVASRGRKLIRNLSINEMNIFENGFLQEFNIVRGGGQSALFNRHVRGTARNKRDRFRLRFPALQPCHHRLLRVQ